MQWQDFQGHSRQKIWFEQAIQQNRLASTFLLVGPDGCGKRTFARLLAKALLCPNREARSIDACNCCESCVQVDADTHPDLLQVSKPPEASSLSIELLVGSRENRLREGLCYQLHMKPFHGQRRIAIIDDADTILVEAANSMLKTLEEPPAGAVIFLIGSNEQRQLSTIRSRSQIVRFHGLATEAVSTLLSRDEWVNDPDKARSIAKLSDGSLVKAKALLDDDFLAFRSELHSRLQQPSLDFVGLAKAVLANAQSVGEEGAFRRARLKLIFEFTIEFYRSMLIPTHESTLIAIPAMRYSLSTANRALELCIAAQSEIERNVTPAALLESWAAELAEICRAA